MMQVLLAWLRISSGSSVWHSTIQATPNSTARRSISGWLPQIKMVSLRRKGGSSPDWGRASTTSPERVLTTSSVSLSSWPSSTLRMLNRGMSRRSGASMVRISKAAISPAVSIPKRCPSSSVTGMAEICSSSCMADQARLTVTASLRMGGTSKSRSWTWVRMFLTKRGGSKPKRLRISLVSSLRWPSRAAVYCRFPRAFCRAA